MHGHARDWQRPAYFERLTWDYEHSLGGRPNWGRWQDGMGLDDEARAILSEADRLVAARLHATLNPRSAGLVNLGERL